MPVGAHLVQVLGGGGRASLQQGDQLAVEGRASSQASPHSQQEPSTALELLLLPLLQDKEQSQSAGGQGSE